MKILFGVFDWGLGHATRDIPLIERLLEKKNTVHILSTGRALNLLKNYFKKSCTYFDVPSIYPPYTKTVFFSASFIYSAPKMLKSLERARVLSAKIIRAGNYDKVVSDCRYDVYDRVENSYLINHQLRFKSFLPAEFVLESWLAGRMKKYKYILVPDFEEPNLTGKLSHSLVFTEENRIKYLGILSHVKKKKVRRDIDYFISMSGPEPQRTILEKKLLSQLGNLRGKIFFAGGTPERNKKEISKNVTFHGFLNSKQQEDILNRSKFVITRSGYTTVMELCELGIRNALLIPTPGQTEQEYLADFYEENKFFHHQHQAKLNLLYDIAASKNFQGFAPPWKTEQSILRFLEFTEI